MSELRIQEFNKKTAPEKYQILKGIRFKVLNQSNLEFESVFEFLQSLIQEKEVKADYRQLAIQCQLLNVISNRKKRSRYLASLLELKPSDDPFVLGSAIRSLFLLHSSDCEETEEFFNSLLEAKEMDVVSSALFFKGLMHFFHGFDTRDRNEYLNGLRESQRLFEASNADIENRTDAKLMIHLCKFLTETTSRKEQKVVDEYGSLIQSLAEFSKFENQESNILIILNKLAHLAFAIYAAFSSSPHQWLDFRKEVKRLHITCWLLFHGIEFNEFYSNDFANDQSENLKGAFLSPVFSANFHNYSTNLKFLLEEIPDDEVSEREFVEYLIDLTSVEDLKSSDFKSQLHAKMLIAFPDISSEQISKDCSEIDDYPAAMELLAVYQNKYRGHPSYTTGFRVGDEVVLEIITKIKTIIFDYPESKLIEFRNVLSDILRYVMLAARKGQYAPYFKYLWKSDASEKEMQKSILEIIKIASSTSEHYRPEVSDIADGGRIDIAYQSDRMFVPIELKQTGHSVSKEKIKEKYISQAQTYVYPYDQLGIFVILDQSKQIEEQPPSGIKNNVHCISIGSQERQNDFHPDLVVAIVIRGNKIVPSARVKSYG